ncbi:MAG: HEAT repeat domain-containing protein [Isosphaeraceae bacterium]|nr:HEAT repeat domain-containing protein [Isosphaeraceae bacterium]
MDELISAALSEPDEDLAWDAVAALHWRGSDDVLDRAVQLCQSVCAVERRLGADILGQLGVPERTFPKKCLRILLEMLEAERESQVLPAILIASSHLKDSLAIGPVVRFRRHADSEVRYGVVFALMGHDIPQALQALIELTRDPEAHVRDWATFSLGTQVETDTPELRQALAERLGDDDDDTRCEALVGLARRGDERVLPALHKELSSELVGTLAVEAAALIGRPELHPVLVALESWWDVDKELLDEAIRACSPRPKPMA